MLHQVADNNNFVRIRLVETWATAPTLCTTVVPLAWWCFVSLGNICTDYIVLSFGLFLLGAIFVVRYIYQLASTCQTCSRDHALTLAWRHNQRRLPIFLWAISCCIAQYLGPWIERYGGWNVRIDIPLFIFRTAVRISFAMAVLGLLVLLRFLGPWSIMRLSTFPLAMNPSTALLQRWIQEPWETLLASDPPVSSSADMILRQSRRWQRPTIRPILQHFMASLVVGFSVAFVTVLPTITAAFGIKDHDATTNSFVSSAVVCTCLFAPVAVILFLLDGVSHEINPMLSFDLDSINSHWFPVVSTKIAWQTGIVTGVVPFLALIVTLWTTCSIPPLDDVARLLLGLVTTSTAIALFMTLLDELFRLKLFHPLSDIDQLIQEVHAGASHDELFTVVLSSLLERPLLVEKVTRPPTRPPGMSPESHELLVWDELVQQMAHVYQRPQLERETFEDDVLRMALLELYGGRRRLSQPERHDQAVEVWTKDRKPKRHLLAKSEQHDQASTIFVRALYMILGGLGEALIRSSEGGKSIPACLSCAWTIPPGAWATMEFILATMERCLVAKSRASSEQLQTSHLSILVPPSLQSIFLLRRGLEQFDQMMKARASKSPVDQMDATARPRDSFIDMMRCCDATAMLLVTKYSVKTTDHSLRSDSRYLQWTESLTQE